ncbi:MAG TPA: Maf family protein [Burkholderiaceae bacterium]|nr:Maf family protein [Burkholderiaceae bacterium]
MDRDDRPSVSPRMIYLASQSPRRQELLRQIDIEFDVLLPTTADEAHALEALEARRGKESPRRYVERVTRLKLDAALKRMRERKLPTRPVLTADTTVALGTMIYGKPEDASDAERMLRELSGTTHRVLTAVAVGSLRRVVCAVSVSEVRFAPLTIRQIRDYIATREPFGKAGAYAIQGRAAAFVQSIKGSHSGIVGLPLHETAALLSEFRR